MYCPKCATQNADSTKFCRSCGSNLSLVPQALTGRLPEAHLSRRGRRRHRDREDDGPATLANGITKSFMGIGFLLVACAAFFFAPAGHIWWFWMLIPAFAMLGKGIAEIVTVKYASPTPISGASQTAMPSPRTGELQPPNDVLYPPPSVTEQTTRQLDPTTDPYRYRDTDTR
jgi:zinc-ribbon domain